MLLVTYNDALQSKPAKYEQLCLTPDYNKYYITSNHDRQRLYFRDLGLKNIQE